MLEQVPKAVDFHLPPAQCISIHSAINPFLTVTEHLCNSQNDRVLPYNYKTHVQLPK